MEKNTNINIQNEANINAKGKLNCHRCKPVICLETGDVFTSIADAAEHAGAHKSNMSQHLCGKLRSVKGKHYCYLSRATESLDAIVTRLRETSAMEEDARKWREYQAEQEAIRKAEQKRIDDERKAKEDHEAAIAKAQEKVARRKAICERMEVKLSDAEKRLMEAEAELAALTGVDNASENEEAA
jgi:chromosome segregation ATPase